MPIDRHLQKRILEMLETNFPAGTDMQNPVDFDTDPAAIYFQLSYLEQHGLVTCIWSAEMSRFKRCLRATITAKGLDFIADDGGLGAVLGVQTIKIHDDTLKALIGQRIQESDLTPPEKSKWLGALRDLPAATTKHLALKLVDKALERSPDVIQWLGTHLNALA